MSDKGENIVVAVNAGMGIVVQLLQITFELARLYNISDEDMAVLFDQESAKFNQNLPGNLPNARDTNLQPTEG